MGLLQIKLNVRHGGGTTRRRRARRVGWESLECRRCFSVASVTLDAPVGDASSRTWTASVNAPGNLPLAVTATALGAGGIRMDWKPLNLTSDGQIFIFRKPLTATAWDEVAIGDPAYDATSFTDTTAAPGSAYEYKVSVFTEFNGVPFEKYVYAGNAAAPVASRGTVLIVVDVTQLDATRDPAGTTLTPTLQQYQADLIAEGYRVLTMAAPRVDVPRTPPANTDPATVAAHFAPWHDEVMSLKARIRSVWQATPSLQTVVLVGHVAVPYSGFINPDGAEHVSANGAWAADAFYTTLAAPDSLWTDTLTAGEGTGTNVNLPGDGKFDQDTLAQLGYGDERYENRVVADVTIGRIDFASMYYHAGIPEAAGSAATPAETRLLASYFAKAHAWRTGQVDVRRLALFEEQFPFPENYDTTRLYPNVGFDGVIAGTVSPLEPGGGDVPFPGDIPAANSHDLATNTWLWMYAGAGGYPTYRTIQFSPGRQLRSDQYVFGADSSPLDQSRANDYGPHRSVFNFIYGSYIGDLDQPESLLRSVIAERDGLGLAVAWGARPNWNQHHMALGEPIGTSLVKTLNSFGYTQAYQFDPIQSSVRLAMAGDPTLREANVRPASDVRTTQTGNATNVTWTASTDAAVAGYHVYRFASPGGPYAQLSATMLTGTSFVDAAPLAGEAYYMVRAARLESTPSGTYWNLALGAVSAPTVAGISFERTPGAHALSFTFSQDVSGSITSDDLILGGTRYDAATRQVVPITLVPGVDFTLASYDPFTRVGRVIFHVTSVPARGGQLPDGRYTLRFAAGGVRNGFGASVDAAYSFGFGYLTGDTNGDLRVNFDDLLMLASRYNTTNVTTGAAAGDFNGDGRVDFDDLLALAANYNVTL